jgi:exopolysaccharide production protein ExoQ
MSGQLATALYGAMIVWLVTRDVKANPDVSHALWIPLIWMLIAGTKSITEWVNGSHLEMTSGGGYLDGSELDRNVYITLIVLGIVIITKRSVSWSRVVTSNWAISLFFFYSLVSLVWSDFPVTAFKRWYKVFGHIVMALVVYTERKPDKAFNALFRRCGYILIPLSVLFIKYYPDLGRGFDVWTGAPVNFGVTNNKNMLGNLCMVMGLFFLASLFVRSDGKRLVSGFDRYTNVLLLVMSGWLLFTKADTTDGSMSTIIGAGAILGSQIAPIRRHFSTLLIIGCLAVGVGLVSPGIKDSVILALGDVGLGKAHDATLTGRTDLWKDVEAIDINPVIGTGFESFWLGKRVEGLWQKYWWHPNQAHNGYYEMFLNLGLIGLALQWAMIVSCYVKVRKQLLAAATHDGSTLSTEENGIAQFRLAFLLGVVAFNSTDATFKAVHLSFFVFFVVALQYTPQFKEWMVRSPLIPVRAPLRAVQFGVPSEGGDGLTALRGSSNPTSRAPAKGRYTIQRKAISTFYDD